MNVRWTPFSTQRNLWMLDRFCCKFAAITIGSLGPKSGRCTAHAAMRSLYGLIYTGPPFIDDWWKKSKRCCTSLNLGLRLFTKRAGSIVLFMSGISKLRYHSSSLDAQAMVRNMWPVMSHARYRIIILLWLHLQITSWYLWEVHMHGFHYWQIIIQVMGCIVGNWQIFSSALYTFMERPHVR